MLRQTKIGATIGPASADRKILTAMVKAGVNFVRLNFSHGTYEAHAKLIASVRAVEKKTGVPLAIMQDLQGPKMRLGQLPEAGVAIKTGDEVSFDMRLAVYQGAALPITYPKLEKFLRAGQRILIDDGRLEVKITRLSGPRFTALVTTGGAVFSHKGLNFPDSDLLDIPAMSVKDKEDIFFGIKMGIDVISLSFLKKPADILMLKKVIAAARRKHGRTAAVPPQVIGKIERPEALANLDKIIPLVDAIMVARGDLGLEMPEAELPLSQKRIIAAANSAGKPVIVATQLLDSMQHSPRPTRAEVSDVANAVIDHADALLLTNETAMGEYPVDTVRTMGEIIDATEQSAYDDATYPAVDSMGDANKGATPAVALTRFSRQIAEELKAKAILSCSITGATARLLSRVRPNVPLFIATPSLEIARQLQLAWGIRPFVTPNCHSPAELYRDSINYLLKRKLLKKNDNVVVVGGASVGQPGKISTIEVSAA